VPQGADSTANRACAPHRANDRTPDGEGHSPAVAGAAKSRVVFHFHWITPRAPRRRCRAPNVDFSGKRATRRLLVVRCTCRASPGRPFALQLRRTRPDLMGLVRAPRPRASLRRERRWLPEFLLRLQPMLGRFGTQPGKVSRSRVTLESG